MNEKILIILAIAFLSLFSFNCGKKEDTTDSALAKDDNSLSLDFDNFTITNDTVSDLKSVNIPDAINEIEKMKTYTNDESGVYIKSITYDYDLDSADKNLIANMTFSKQGYIDTEKSITFQLSGSEAKWEELQVKRSDLQKALQNFGDIAINSNEEKVPFGGGSLADDASGIFTVIYNAVDNGNLNTLGDKVNEAFAKMREKFHYIIFEPSSLVFKSSGETAYAGFSMKIKPKFGYSSFESNATGVDDKIEIRVRLIGKSWE